MEEEIVNVFFLKLWEKRKAIDIKDSVQSYFYKSIYNQSIKYLEHLKVMKKYEDYAREMLHRKDLLTPLSDGYPHANLISKETVIDIEKAIDQLPEKCRGIFCLCRFENMSYEDISARLNISVKFETVMTNGLRLKIRLSKDFSGGIHECVVN